MTIAVFISLRTEHRYADDLRRYVTEEARVVSEAARGLKSIDLFVPERGDVVAFDQRDAPAVMVELDLDSRAAAGNLVDSDAFRERLLAQSAYPAPIEQLSLDVLEPVHFPIPGHPTPPPRIAPLSFVVRYHGPTRDLAAFDQFYMDNHPALLARFPAIRNVLCYLPMDWRETGRVDDSRLIIGNEVVFDDLDALNRALESDVLPLLIADGKRFPEFGSNSHHAMRRERIGSGSVRRLGNRD